MNGRQRTRPAGVVAVAALLVVLSLVPAALLAAAAAAAPWAWPVAAGAALFGLALARGLAGGHRWARRAALVVLWGVVVEAALFAAVNAWFDATMVWAEGTQVASVVGISALAGAALLLRHRSWFAAEPAAPAAPV